jgi:protein-tyrosine phosphatase
MYNVLFICTGNQYRSPIAAEAFREQLRRDGRAPQWVVNSAGTWTASGRSAPRDAVELAQSYGVNITGHVTRMLDAKMLEEADLILVMEQGHKESILVEFPFSRSKTFLLAKVLDGLEYDIPDPASSRAESRQIIHDLVMMIRARSANIYKVAESTQSLA